MSNLCNDTHTAAIVDTYPHEPHDGHSHEWEFAEGIELNSDYDALVCIKCGLLTVE